MLRCFRKDAARCVLTNLQKIMQFRAALFDDIAPIEALQNLNLYANIAESERAGGFVTTPFSGVQLQVWMNQNGAFVAENAGEIVAYVLAGSWDLYAQWPIFPFMIARLEEKSWRGFSLRAEDTFQYGPVCIAQNWRGHDVLPRLFAVLRQSFAPRYEVGLSFINAQNARSLAAHRKLGMETIDRWSFGERDYFTLAFETRALETRVWATKS